MATTTSAVTQIHIGDDDPLTVKIKRHETEDGREFITLDLHVGTFDTDVILFLSPAKADELRDVLLGACRELAEIMVPA